MKSRHKIKIEQSARAPDVNRLLRSIRQSAGQMFFFVFFPKEIHTVYV